ncbi:hypothetical protein [Piscinibacter sp.]|jgi:hypothetical protein|uniref:hypothetical protein n=1 Tax=Piscinibacter sp. TaxID=1903157 RepID=UPI002F3ED7BE
MSTVRSVAIHTGVPAENVADLRAMDRTQPAALSGAARSAGMAFAIVPDHGKR